MKRYILFLLLFMAANLQAQQPLWKPWYVTPRLTQGQHLDLNGSWTLRYRDQPVATLDQLSDTGGISTQIPSSVHWSLFNAGKLPHPYYNNNSDRYRWVDQKVWYYQKQFNYKVGTDSYAFLCFDGLDYFARVWLNGRLLGQHEGMFGGPSVEVSKYLNNGQNQLVVELRAGDYGNPRPDISKLPRNSHGEKNTKGLKGYNPVASGEVIKPWVISGGSAAEMFFSVGLWQPVRLEIVPKVYLERPFLTTKAIAGDKATLHLSAELFSEQNALDENLHTGALVYRRRDTVPVTRGNYSLTVSISYGTEKEQVFNYPLTLKKGRNWFEQDITIPKPHLWNPAGWGQPNLYRVRLALKHSQSVTDEVAFDYGIRTIERVFSAGPRTADNWDKWQFVINGKKVFVKGMNFTPQDVLLRTDTAQYKWTLEAARDMGVKMIRVWGGGLLETNQFYELCDRLGLMVWQDFPIGNQETPDYPQDVWEAQVVQNICRLRNHPSLVVWCGGNEFNPYAQGNAATLGILERNLKIFDSSRPYQRSSPDGGSAHVYPNIDPALYNVFYKNVPWMAETGIHSMPEATMFRELVDGAELYDPGRMWENDFEAKHPQFVNHFGEYGPARVPAMLSRASHIADMSNPDLETMAEASQIGAGEFYQVLSDKMQGNYPVTTGLMPWVFKRQWPIIAIQFMDWFGQANAPYYFLKRTYEPTHLMLDLPRLVWAPGETIALKGKLINDRALNLADAQLTVRIYDDKFTLLTQQQQKASLHAQEAAVRDLSFKNFRIAAGYRDRFLLILAELHDRNGNLISRSFYYPRVLSKLSDPKFHADYVNKERPWITLDKGPWLKPTIASSITELRLGQVNIKALGDSACQAEVTVINKGNKPAVMTQLDITGIKRVFVASDNYFWLSPGESRKITLKIRWREPLRSAKLQLRSWNSAPVITDFSPSKNQH